MSIDAQIEQALQAEKDLLRRRNVPSWDASEVIGMDGIEAGAFSTINANDQRWATWHGRGTNVEGKAFTAADAMRLVPQLALEVVDRPLGWQDEAGEWHTLTREVANVRMDGTYLGTVTKRYKKVQPWESFQFMDDLVDSGDAHYTNVMTLRGGKQIALLSLIPEEWEVLGASRSYKLYLYLTNSYDGQRGLTVALTPVCVQCTNSDTLALATAPRSFTLRHTEGIQGKINAARSTLGMVAAYKEEFTTTVESLAGQKMTSREFGRFMDNLIPLPVGDELTDRKVESRKVVVDAITSIFQSAPNLEPIRGTRYAALESVTEYEDWFTNIRGKTPEVAAEKRAVRQLSSNAMKDRALALLS